MSKRVNPFRVRQARFEVVTDRQIDSRRRALSGTVIVNGKYVLKADTKKRRKR